MLARISSRELSEWEAYERYAGPLGTAYGDEVMAALHEQIQRLNRLQGAAHFTDRNHKKNPVPEPKAYPRPYEIYPSNRDEPDEDEDQFDDSALVDGRDFGSQATVAIETETEEEGDDWDGDGH